MISKRLKNIFVISIPIFIAHGLEEYFTEFFNVDKISRFVFSPLETMPVLQANFLLFQIMLWLVFVVFALLISSEKWRLRLMIIPGLIYIFELHHLWKALMSWGYYPGLITAFIFPIIGFLFWRELLKHYKRI